MRRETRGITAIRAVRNTGKVTPVLLLRTVGAAHTYRCGTGDSRGIIFIIVTPFPALSPTCPDVLFPGRRVAGSLGIASGTAMAY